MTNGYFTSPTFGQLNLPSVRLKILSFMENDPQSKYRIVIGSDSQPKNDDNFDFITAIVVHRVGKGGIYFFKREVKKGYRDLKYLRKRIYEEATLSLTTADTFLEVVKNDGITKFDVEIHVDIGNFGETREMINEIVGMIRGSGFIVKTKPDSFAATKVADRHT